MRRSLGATQAQRSLVAATLALLAVGCRRNPDRLDGSRAADVRGRPLPHSTRPRIGRGKGAHPAGTFDVAKVRLGILDLRMSTRLDEALSRTSAILAVNGGFFDSRGNPVGACRFEGKLAGELLAEDMSGGVLWMRDGVAHLSATEDYHAGPVDFAIQCRLAPSRGLFG